MADRIADITLGEHDHLPGKVRVKKSGNYIWNPTGGDDGLGDWERWDGLDGISIPAYDYASCTYNSDNDVWVFKTGGSGGTTVATVTITYTDTTKADISTVART